MDEVWKDINFPSFQEHTSSTDHLRSPNFRSTNFQHFLSRPFSTTSSSRYGSPVPPPATMLTLNTTHESHLFRSNEPLREVIPPLVHHHTVPKVCPDSSKTVDSFPDSNGKKRQPDIDSSSSDRRHKRMIKNRDAAARSRARKQESAYTDELELEVAYLVEENARLRKQQKQLCLAATAQQPEKRKFCRATSAPL